MSKKITPTPSVIPTESNQDRLTRWIDDVLTEWTMPVPTYRDGTGGSQSTPDPFTSCPAWCSHQGHIFSWSPEDRWHSSAACNVPLQLEDAQETGRRGEYELEVARTYLIQGHRESEPHIEVCKGDLAGIKLTLGEAESYARAILALVEIGRGHFPPAATRRARAA